VPIFAAMSVTHELRRRLRAEQSFPGYEPCLPRPAKQPPAGPGWIHEIKHDGFRILAHRSGGRVRLLTRAGNNFANRFPLIVVRSLPCPYARASSMARRSCATRRGWPYLT
jgi:ATP-dependent DNA ligase